MRDIFKILALLFLGGIASDLYSQVHCQDDFRKYIEAGVCDSNSEFYYPRLLEKVENRNEELTRSDSFYLYYGQMLQPGFVGDDDSLSSDYIKFEKAVRQERFPHMVRVGSFILESSPADLYVLFHVESAIKKGGLEDDGNFLERFDLLVSAILSTGDGSSPEKAIKILHRRDAAVIKEIMDFWKIREPLYFEDVRTFDVWGME